MQQRQKVVIQTIKAIKYKKNPQVLSNKINKINELKTKIRIKMKIKAKITMIL